MEKVKKVNPNPNEMFFRKIYWPLLRDGSLNTIFRPGRRLTTEDYGYHEGQLVTVRIITHVGADWAGLQPELSEALTKRIRIKSVVAKKVREVTIEDFNGSSPDVHDHSSLMYHLGVIYNLFPDEIGPDSFVTITKFTYVE